MPGIEQAAVSPAAAGRVDEILRAACRVVVMGGASDLRIGTVAQEAGVSRTLVHYYFTTRQELLRAAFAYAENMRVEALEAELATLADAVPIAPSGRSCARSTRRSRRTLRSGTRSGRACATTRSFGRSCRSATARGPIGSCGCSRRVARTARSRSPSIPRVPGWRLAAAADGIDSILYLGLLDRDDARVLLASCVIRELEPMSDAALPVGRPRVGLASPSTASPPWTTSRSRSAAASSSRFSARPAAARRRRCG